MLSRFVSSSFITRYQGHIITLVFVIVGLVAFSPVFHFQLLSDDWDLVYHADRYEAFVDRFTLNDHQTTEGYSYRPVVGVYLTILKSFFGLNPIGYHAFFVLVHILNAVLVFILARKIFWSDGLLARYGNRLKPVIPELIAGSAALLFLLLPAHAEAVFWISAGTDLVASSFYLLSILFFLSYLDQTNHVTSTTRFVSRVSCLVFFILGLLTKEIAITLPIALFVLFFFYHLQDQERYDLTIHDRVYLRQIFLRVLKEVIPFLILAGIYFLLRWKATGLVFGYYGRSNVVIDFGQWVRMAADILSSFFVWGDTRLRLSEIFQTQFHWLIVLLAFVVLYFKKFHREYLRVFSVVFLLFVFSALPVLPLGFNPLSNEGERYGYLPSVFFVILFVFVLSVVLLHPTKVNKNNDREKYSRERRSVYVLYVVFGLISLIFLIYFGYGLKQKMGMWQTYQDTNYQILNQLYQFDDGRKMVIAGLPDSYQGVPGFRNGVEEAYRMYFGENIDIIRIPAYTVDGGKVNHVLRITYYGTRIQEGVEGYTSADGLVDRGTDFLFLKTKDESLRLTGEKEYEDEYVDVQFFRWHYDINRADGVTIKLKEKLLKDAQNGEVSLILFDGTRLVRVL